MSVPRQFGRCATWRTCHTPLASTSSICILASGARRIHAGTPPPRAGISTAFTVLALVGASATAYGIYNFYTSFAVWPSELREDLRPAIKAQHQGDLMLSERYLRRAWSTCRTIPHVRLGSEPWLKLSGVACKLGEVLEDADRLHLAYEIYAECFDMMQAANDKLSVAEKHRAVAVAMHLGKLANALGMREDEEKYLTWSMEESLRMSKSGQRHAGSTRRLDESRTADLTLPEWTHNEDLEVALEALGSFYAKAGKADYAIPLYMEAISTIMHTNHTSPSETSPERRCRAAQLMTNISSLLILDTPSPERLAQANAWTTSGLKLTEKARRSLNNPYVECERVWAVLLFNLGAVLEMQNEREAAREHFEHARSHAKGIGMPEGVQEAEDALTRLSSGI